MAVYGLEVPAGDVAIAAKPDIPAAFRITMAAIDPSQPPEHSDATETAQPRATLKIIREPLHLDMEDYDDDESDFDEDEMNAMLAEGEDEDDESSEDEEVAGGPSDPKKSKKARKEAAADQLRRELEAQMDVDMPNGKGKGKLVNGDDEDDDEEDDEDDDDESIDEPEEFVICTLDPSKV